ncbi:putative phage abortive infection protein [Acinetobacter pittii]|uniref:putative phage abortive infection protein n=1 Tax=Acinetobacter pittii TaxID=48296 RepID=UPI00249F005C|nr:putative phage abortive infection protein [Acinetobacter pittii]WHA55251.1 hypothetical protein OH685_18505 [Acinetobacter pittii]
MGSIIRSKLIYVLLILVIFFIWIYFPFIFMNLMKWMGWLGTDLKGYGEYGAIGDIYGSLNTFISSIALCAVAFTTYLQVKSLEESRKSNQEIQLANEFTQFTSQFYNLLNYKNERVKLLCLKNGTDEIVGFEVFRAYHFEYLKVIKNEWKEKCDGLESQDVQSMLRVVSKRLNKGKNYYELSNYFNLYTQIFSLIDNTNLNKVQRKFAIDLVRSTMTLSEQLIMFFIAPHKGRLFVALEDKEIFNTFFHKLYIPFAKNFYNESFFYIEPWKSVFNDNENPT